MPLRSFRNPGPLVFMYMEMIASQSDPVNGSCGREEHRQKERQTEIHISRKDAQGYSRVKEGQQQLVLSEKAGRRMVVTCVSYAAVTWKLAKICRRLGQKI